MSKNLYVIFFKNGLEGKTYGSWYTTLKDATAGYYDEGFQERYRIASLRMIRLPDDAGYTKFNSVVDKIEDAETPDFSEWITLESKNELTPEEILDRELAKVCAAIGSTRTEVFRSMAKNYAVLRIDHRYYHYKVDGQRIKKTVINP